MAVEQLKNLIGVIRKDPSKAPDGQYDQVSEGKTSVVADMYNLDFKDKRALAEVCQLIEGVLFESVDPRHFIVKIETNVCLGINEMHAIERVQKL